MGEFVRKYRHWFILAGIVLLGIGIRSLCWRDAFQEGRVYFYANDSWYHMRRIVYALKNNFALSDFPQPDPYLNYPEGGQGYWGPLFDLGIAGAIKVLGINERHNQEVLAAIIPAVLGGFCVIGAFLLASVFWDKTAAYFAAFFMAILPGHIFYSQLGHLDHHVAESLLFGLILAAFLHLPRQEEERKRLWLTGITGLLILTLYLITPSTSNIHLGVIWAACLAKILSPAEDDKPEGIKAIAHGFILGGLLLLIPALYWAFKPVSGIRLWGDLPRWLMIEWYSFLQPALITLGGLSLFLISRIKDGQKNWQFWIAAGVGLILLAVLLKPVFSGIAVLLKTNPDLKFTSEAQPILYPAGSGGIHFGMAFDGFGYALLLFPLWWWHLYLKDSKGKGGLFIICAILLALMLLQLRFVYTFSYAMALALGWAAWEISKRKKIWMAGALAFLFLMWPSLRWLHSSATHRQYFSVPKGYYDLCLWMKENAPEADAYSRGNSLPPYSVMAIWDMGHAIIYLGEQAVVADPFNHGFEISAQYFTATKPKDAVEILKNKNVRFVIPIDYTNEYLQKAYSGYARLPADHPLRNGEWFRIFQTQIFMGLKLPGPDGKPSPWGHHLVYRAPDNSALLFEFRPTEI